jgi:hypothetical protein
VWNATDQIAGARAEDLQASGHLDGQNSPGFSCAEVTAGREVSAWGDDCRRFRQEAPALFRRKRHANAIFPSFSRRGTV